MKRINYTFIVLAIFINSIYSQVDTLSVYHTSGISSSTVTVSTYNPLTLNGHKYNITFNHVTDTTVTWNLFDSTLQKTVLTNQATTDNSGNEVQADNMIISIDDGLKKVGMVDYSIPNGKLNWSSTNANKFALEGFGGSIGNAENLGILFTNVPYFQIKNVLIVFAQTDVNGNIINSNDPNLSFAYRYLRYASYDPVKPEFAPYIVNATGGYAYQDYKKNFPFAAFDVSGSVPRRLMVGYLENNVQAGTVDGKYWPPSSIDGIDNSSNTGPREWFFIFNTDYSETPDPQLQVNLLSSPTPLAWAGTPTRNGNISFDSGDEFLIIAGSFNLTSADTFSFTAFTNNYLVPNQNRTKLNKGKISTWIYNNGILDKSPYGILSGQYFPKGTQNTCMYISGFLWGGIINGETRVGGSAYDTGLQPGKIMNSGLADDPALPKNRIYRVRPDYNTADLYEESADEWQTTDVIKQGYMKDLQEWPASDGAPFTDINNNGTYDADIDIPGINGASQTVWYVCNDLDKSLTQGLYGSNPLGIEMQATFWNYDSANFYDNMIFRKYKLINKGSYPITNMYCTLWADPDIGFNYDDFAGSDTSRNMCYAYNSTDMDSKYGNLPPATGFVLLQTPIIPSSGDQAYFDGKWRNNYVNVPMNASYYFINNITDPIHNSYDGTLQFYNYMQGKIGNSGEYFKDNDGNSTSYVLTGNPITQTGWIAQSPDDIRIGMAAGPFNMAVGDTQEVVIAEVVANASLLIGRNEALVNLFKYSDRLKKAFPHAVGKIVGVKEDKKQVIKTFSLNQNYPNPFNPVTKITYEIPKAGMVTLKVYNMLGQEVATLVNEIKNTGKYTVHFNGANLTSGIYIYKLIAEDYSSARKMILLK